MKNSHQCPKCDSNDVIRVHNDSYGAYNKIGAGWGGLVNVSITRYVCLDCGYVEEWIDSPWELEKLRKHYHGKLKRKNG